MWLGTPPMAPVNTGCSKEVINLKNGILDIFKTTKFSAQDFVAFAEWIRSLWTSVKLKKIYIF